MGESVAGVLEVLDSLRVRLGVGVVQGERFEHASGGHDVRVLLLEEVEELLFTREEPKHGRNVSEPPRDVNGGSRG